MDLKRESASGSNPLPTDYALNSCLHELIEAQVERSRESVALLFEQQTVSYREMNARANQVAHHHASRRRYQKPAIHAVKRAAHPANGEIVIGSYQHRRASTGIADANQAGSSWIGHNAKDNLEQPPRQFPKKVPGLDLLVLARNGGIERPCTTVRAVGARLARSGLMLKKA
jgi:hypothetical protein